MHFQRTSESCQIFRVVLCTTHGCCYTRQNLSRHLLEKHGLKARERQRIESSSRLNYIATSSTDVVQPRDGINEIRGLLTVLGLLCHLPDCDFRSTNSDWIRMHYDKEHQWQVVHQGAIPWHEAYMQTLFQKMRFPPTNVENFQQFQKTLQHLSMNSIWPTFNSCEEHYGSKETLMSSTKKTSHLIRIGFEMWSIVYWWKWSAVNFPKTIWKYGVFHIYGVCSTDALGTSML